MIQQSMRASAQSVMRFNLQGHLAQTSYVLRRPSALKLKLAYIKRTAVIHMRPCMTNGLLVTHD